MSFNLAALYAQHKVGLIAGGGGATAALALLMRHRAKASAAAAGTTPMVDPSLGSSSGQAYTGAGYDSTASDIYNSLQGQLQSQFDQWAATHPGTTSSGSTSSGSSTTHTPAPGRGIPGLGTGAGAGSGYFHPGGGGGPHQQPHPVQPVHHAPAPPAQPRPRAPRPAPHRPAPRPPAHRPTVVTVSHGDSLSSIGRRYGLSWQQVYAANRKAVGSNPNLIHPGLKLTIPGR